MIFTTFNKDYICMKLRLSHESRVQLVLPKLYYLQIKLPREIFQSICISLINEYSKNASKTNFSPLRGRHISDRISFDVCHHKLYIFFTQLSLNFPPQRIRLCKFRASPVVDFGRLGFPTCPQKCHLHEQRLA